MTSLMKKMIPMVIVVVMIVGTLNTAVIYASTPIDKNFMVEQLSNTIATISEGKSKSKIILTENADKIVAEIVPLSGEGEAGYFFVDKRKETLYSSFTGETLSKNEVSQLIDLGSIQENPDKLFAASSTVTKNISYATMSKLITNTSSAASIAGAILTVLAWAGITAANPIAGVVSIIGGLVTAIQIGIGKKSSNHGLKVKMKKNKITKHQAGQVFTTYKYMITDISKY